MNVIHTLPGAVSPITNSTGPAGALLLGLLSVCLAACSPGAGPDTGENARMPAGGPPIARIENVVDTYHGVDVDDPYRWLENWNDEDVKAWTRAQDAFARAYLEALPERAAVRARARQLLVETATVAYDSLSLRNETLFALKSDPSKQQRMLVALPVSGDPDGERVLVDPNAIDATGLTTIDWYEVSHDGGLVAVSLSRAGSEAGDLHIFSADTGEPLDDIVPRVQGGTAGGDAAWLADDSGLYYTHYPRPGERSPEDAMFYVQVYLHRLGEPPESDSYVIGEAFPRIAEIRLFVDAASRRLLVSVQDGDSGRFVHFLEAPGDAAVQLGELGDGLVQLAFGEDGRLYGVSTANDPRGEIVAINADRSNPDIEVLVPAGDGAITHSFYDKYSPSLIVTGDRLYALYQNGGPNELRVFDLEGRRLEGPAAEPVSTTHGLTDAGDSDVLFATESYVTLSEWFAFDPETNATRRLAISTEQTVDLADVSVVREFARSKDGTEVPVTVLMPPGAARDGTRALIVTGYGGYGLSYTPGLSVAAPLVLEKGIGLAFANLRGGGEYGEAWHRAGMLTEKQNVFDDFIAVVEHLVARGYADPSRVGIFGASNGGLLMGAVVTQRPELFRAVVSRVGIYDSLRTELDPNGEFNVPEFGSVRDAAQFAALRAYSPYHNVTDGTVYPAILLVTGANDPRVNPMHSRKFAARLQAAQAGDQPIVLRANEDSGHGTGSSIDQVVERTTDQFTFLIHALDQTVD